MRWWRTKKKNILKKKCHLVASETLKFDVSNQIHLQKSLTDALQAQFLDI